MANAKINTARLQSTSHTKINSPWRIKLLAAAMAACFAFTAAPAFAATITVNAATDAGGGANCTLRQAIAAANSNAIEGGCTAGAAADTIIFAAGLNNQTITLNGSQINITDTAALTIDASALVDGITISGNNASRVFGVKGAQLLTLKSLTITQGRSTEGNDELFTLDCDSPNNFPNGGAICAEGGLTLIDSTLSNSSTTGENASGGGFHAAGDITLTNSTVSGNSTAGFLASGGGFRADGDITLTNSTVSGNSTAGQSAPGGGFYSVRDITLTNSTVSGNSTAGGHSPGGGFYSFRDITLTNSTVSGNSTAGQSAPGGGFYSFRDITLTNSTVSGNSTAGEYSSGGGLNSGAGGVFSATTSLNNSTISQNQAQHPTAEGDGVFILNNNTSLTLNSTILSGNGTDNFATGNNPAVNASRSLFGDVGEITGTGANNFLNIINNNPGLTPLANNSGCTVGAGAPGSAMCVQVHALLSSSQALDNGDANSLATDQRGIGFPRVLGAQADIGAVEGLLSPPAPIIPPNPFGECDGVAGINTQDVTCTINKVLNP